MSANSLVYNADTVQFSSAPTTDSGRQLRRVQPMAFSLGGVPYIYDRGIKIIRHPLSWFKQSTVIRDSLYTFYDTASFAEKCLVIWYDQDNNPHTVRFTSDGITDFETHPGNFTIRLTLEEIL